MPAGCAARVERRHHRLIDRVGPCRFSGVGRILHFLVDRSKVTPGFRNGVEQAPSASVTASNRSSDRSFGRFIMACPLLARHVLHHFATLRCSRVSPHPASGRASDPLRPFEHDARLADARQTGVADHSAECHELTVDHCRGLALAGERRNSADWPNPHSVAPSAPTNAGGHCRIGQVVGIRARPPVIANTASPTAASVVGKSSDREP